MSASEILEQIRSLPLDEQITLLKRVAEEFFLPEGAYFRPGEVYPIWSPYDSYEAAAALAEFLEEERRKQ
jgi:hypothetical protein